MAAAQPTFPSATSGTGNPGAPDGAQDSLAGRISPTARTRLRRIRLRLPERSLLRRELVPGITACGGVLVLIGSLAIGVVQLGTPWAELTLGQLAPILLPLVLLALAGTLLRAGSWPLKRKPWQVAGQMLAGSLAISAASLTALGSLLPDTAPNAALILANSVALALVWYAITTVFDGIAQHGGALERAVIVGATAGAATFIEQVRARQNLEIVGIFDDRHGRVPQTISGVPVLGSVEQMLAWTDLPRVDRVVIAIDHQAISRVRNVLSRMAHLPQCVSVLFDAQHLSLAGTTAILNAQDNLADLSGRPVDPWRAFRKRCFDIVMAGTLLVAFAPVMLVIAIAIASTSRGPVLFRQTREGLNNKLIRVCKFRTMCDSAESASMKSQVQENDPRITKVGAFLRRTSLDELPQFFNVLAGDMTLVGPRPHALGMKTAGALNADLVRHYAHRHRIRPGLTGLAQIKGSRGPVRTQAELEARIALDITYIERQSLWLDLRIILATLPALLGDKACVR